MVRVLARMSQARVTVAHLGLEDAPLRLGLHGDELFVRVMPRSQLPVARTIAAALAEFATDGAVLIAPMGIGGHVDHLIARRAVDAFAGGNRRALFYEDQPYAAHTPRQARCAARNFRLACRMAFPPAAKAELLHCYPSQIDEREIDAILRYDARVFLGRRFGRFHGNGHTESREPAAAERLWSAGSPRHCQNSRRR